MTAKRTSGKAHVTERQKAWARLALMAVVGFVCPPLAAARSGLVWVLYLVLVVLYSLWTVRVMHRSSGDHRLGYVLCLADGIILLPILVWSSGVAMRTVLILLWAGGLATTWSAARAAAIQKTESRQTRVTDVAWKGGLGAPLERALRVRLRVLEVNRTRFALVVLQVAGYEEMVAYYGDNATEDALEVIGRKGLRLLGPDAQLFLLPGGRMAFVFATDGVMEGSSRDHRPTEWIDPYDVETVAMALGRRACEQSVDGHRLECVVGWASAPADGMNADDLMYAAESGALSTAAFRRVGGSPVAVAEPRRKRAAAG